MIPKLLMDLFAHGFTAVTSLISNGMSLITEPFKRVMGLNGNTINPVMNQVSNFPNQITNMNSYMGSSRIEEYPKNLLDNMAHPGLVATNNVIYEEPRTPITVTSIPTEIASSTEKIVQKEEGSVVDSLRDGAKTGSAIVLGISNFLPKDTGIPIVDTVGNAAHGIGHAMQSLSKGDAKGAVKNIVDAGVKSALSPFKKGATAAGLIAGGIAKILPKDTGNPLLDTVGSVANGVENTMDSLSQGNLNGVVKNIVDGGIGTVLHLSHGEENTDGRTHKMTSNKIIPRNRRNSVFDVMGNLLKDQTAGSTQPVMNQLQHTRENIGDMLGNFMN
ncbi:hypothetical protein QAD02_010306 [Eretmocerus hayati]|uniref:Uncharacterized protein n=1 Tax=Eretmocerus hayati TaxID=131215 RepID=A0ACC2NCY4_9HYME|nr:hypothetical protein QAD02_010306 [Eretmocerus hayati]